MKRKAMWVTVDGTPARLDTKVRSVHRTVDGARRAALKAARAGLNREVVSAQVIALMQAGKDSTIAHQALAGRTYEPAYVEVES